MTLTGKRDMLLFINLPVQNHLYYSVKDKQFSMTR